MDALVSSASLFSATLRPWLFIACALLSTAALYDTRRCGFAFYASALWTLAILFYPHIFFPLYLIARYRQRRNSDHRAHSATSSRRAIALNLLIPLVYLSLVVSVFIFLFERDEHSFDACLERAVAAKVRDDHHAAIDNYRAALAVQTDAHTRKLLGLELFEVKNWAAALEQFRAAQDAGEPDAALDYYIATSLANLKRDTEAHPYFARFYRSALCTQAVPDQKCPQKAVTSDE